MGEKPLHWNQDWLDRTFKDARQRIRYKNTPAELVNMGYKITLPIEDDEAEELYNMMNTHFKAWTGKDLRSFK